MRKFNLELTVGIFVIGGFLCFAWLAVRLGDVKIFGPSSYPLRASFGSVSGLKPGATVEIAGVKVGEVSGIWLDDNQYEADIEMTIQKKIAIQDDSIASIRTSGIIGDRYVNISPGGSANMLKAGESITETESAINLEELISKYIFEKK